jgi:hypothetical protein
MKAECEKNGAHFMRYADDIVLLCPDEYSRQNLMFYASEELHRVGLNINVAKVKCLSKENFELWWGFNILNNFERGFSLEAFSN